jgi:hypothetical protein
MHVEGGWADLSLTEHHMHLASMMRLVIKEMKDGWGSLLHVIFPSAIGVSRHRSLRRMLVCPRLLRLAQS